MWGTLFLDFLFLSFDGWEELIAAPLGELCAALHRRA